MTTPLSCSQLSETSELSLKFELESMRADASRESTRASELPTFLREGAVKATPLQGIFQYDRWAHQDKYRQDQDTYHDVHAEGAEGGEGEEGDLHVPEREAEATQATFDTTGRAREERADRVGVEGEGEGEGERGRLEKEFD